MKQILLMCVVLCLVIDQAQAQRRLPDQRSIQLTAGVVDGFNLKKAYHLGAALSRYTANGNQWIYGVEFLEKSHCYKCQRIPVDQFTAEGGYYYNFLSNRGKDVFVSCGLSALAGYEVSNWGTKTLPDGATLQHKDDFVYGCAATLEIETFVCDRVAVLLNVQERFLLGSSFNKFHTQIGIGIRYIYK